MIHFVNIKTHPLVQKTYHYLVSQIADVYLISFPKSGRTWLRMLLAQYFSLKYNLKLNLDLYKMTFGKDLPNISTDPRIGNYAKHGGTKPLSITKNLHQKKIIFLVRDPKDVLVSYFFEWSKRRKLGYQKSLSSFIREDFTLPKIVQFMNLWGEEMQKRPDDFVLVRYEDLHQSTSLQLKRVLQFLDVAIDEALLEEAVSQSSFNNMLKMEASSKFGSDHRLTPTNKEDRNSYKMRKGKVGGYKSYFGPEDLTYINQRLGSLLPLFDYKNQLIS